MSKDFVKIVHLGHADVQDCKQRPAPVFAKIIFSDGKLSLTGVEGPMSNGNARGGGGQIVLSPSRLVDYAEGWDADKVAKFFELWRAWHLNDMRAGSPRQTAWIEDNRLNFTASNRSNFYDWAVAGLKEAGLQPDTEFEHGGKPYSYGSAWLRVEVPDDVIEFFKALPPSPIKPVWV